MTLLKSMKETELELAAAEEQKNRARNDGLDFFFKNQMQLHPERVRLVTEFLVRMFPDRDESVLRLAVVEVLAAENAVRGDIEAATKGEQ